MSWIGDRFDDLVETGVFEPIVTVAEIADRHFQRLDEKVTRGLDKLEKAAKTLDDLLEDKLAIFDVTANTKKSSPDYGDVIGIDRGPYEHYGIYIGDNRVIHYTSFDDELRNAEIMETGLDHFLQEQKFYFVFNCERKDKQKICIASAVYRQCACNPLSIFWEGINGITIYSPEETVHRARTRIGEKKYNLLFNNCEHFAIWCKTGLSKSYQIERLLNIWTRTIQKSPWICSGKT